MLPRIVLDCEPKTIVKWNCNEGALIFIDASGGTETICLISLLLTYLRQNQRIVVTAATLLDGGRTAHVASKLTLNLTQNEQTMFNISKN